MVIQIKKKYLYVCTCKLLKKLNFLLTYRIRNRLKTCQVMYYIFIKRKKNQDHRMSSFR